MKCAVRGHLLTRARVLNMDKPFSMMAELGKCSVTTVRVS
jgi:hypothetical protein